MVSQIVKIFPGV